MKKVFHLLSIALVAAVMFACSSASSPEAATKAYLKNMQKGDYNAMIEQVYFTKPLNAEQKAELVGMVEEKAKSELEKKGGLASFEIGEIEMSEDGKKAKANYTLTFGDGSTKQDDENLVLVDGKWMIDSGK
jgi:hypothetical protein